MQIDWKYIATTKGYLSLKAAYIKDVQDAEAHRRRFKSEPMRDKAEFLRLFNWVICRAKHYAYIMDISLVVILDGWEDKRNGWWLNYYQEQQQPKRHSNHIKRVSIKGIKRIEKRSRFYDPIRSKQSICSQIQYRQRDASTKSPKRWTSEYKRRYAKYR